MALIRSRDTKLELKFRRALHGAGIRGWRCHVRNVFGVPDLAWQGRKLAVFVDSAWWHGHPSRWSPGTLPGEWDEKIRQNKKRDAEVTARLAEDGWRVLRFWDFEIERDLDQCVDEVKAALLEGPNEDSQAVAEGKAPLVPAFSSPPTESNR